MAFKLIVVALCAFVASVNASFGYGAGYGYAAPAVLARSYVAPRAVSGYSSGVTHAVAVEKHTVATPLAYGYRAHGYAAPAVVAKSYVAPAHGYAAPAVVAKTYAAPTYGYAALAYGYAAPAYGYAAPAYGYVH
ncbi:cuticle protein 16.5-like [Pollicipes pollicipes]|uniref:cuticle protein 16.5-like n=1 Tax=Pollicipes pollicipes TaxID=41117 RepID=UPI001884F2D5|nr:cuticle protein 16.5-like [Pollicipes pollicipes]